MIVHTVVVAYILFNGRPKVQNFINGQNGEKSILLINYMKNI